MPLDPQERTKTRDQTSSRSKKTVLVFFFIASLLLGWKTYYENRYSERVYIANATTTEMLQDESVAPVEKSVPPLDTVLYDKKMLQLANVKPLLQSTTTSSTTPVIYATSSGPWPIKTVYPNAGALLPFNRIIAYYGNFYSTRMGILGEYEPEIVLEKLRGEVDLWNKADPTTPAIPAIHYIAAVAQADKGQDGDYLARMPDEHIEKAITLAKQVNGIVFLDLQMGHSTVSEEVHAISSYLARPEVHLGLDPEFTMINGQKPGTYVGTMDASQINQAAEILAKIVRDNNLPPKILMIHRFTEKMVTNYQNIKPLPEVQIVMNMDGWGSPQLKTGTYKHVIYPEPVQFTGVKLFYKNDLRKPSTRMLTPEEILNFTPKPSYIQYQ